MELIKSRIKSYSIAISREHIEKFKKLLSTKAKKTKADRLRYLERALRDLNYELSPDRLQEYIAELHEISPNVAQHVAKALKLFIKHVIKDPNLYSAFKTPRTEVVPREIPTIDDIRKVARAIEWPPAKAYFALLAETGLRPQRKLNQFTKSLTLLNLIN